MSCDKLLPSLLTRERRGGKNCLRTHRSVHAELHTHTYIIICVKLLITLKFVIKLELTWLQWRYSLKMYIVQINPNSVLMKCTRGKFYWNYENRLGFCLKFKLRFLFIHVIKFAVRMCRTFEMSPRSLWTVSIHNWYAQSSRSAQCKYLKHTSSGGNHSALF